MEKSTKGISAEQAGREADKSVRAETLRLLKQSGPSLEKTLQRIDEALDANIVKPHFNLNTNKWSYSKPLVDHRTRVQAAQVSLDLWDAMPDERHRVESDGPLAIIISSSRKRSTKGQPGGAD